MRRKLRRPGLSATVLIYAAAQFVVLTVAAMLVYPGGAKFARGSDAYLSFENFFSDLGATKTYTGRSNTASHVIFIVALVSLGLASRRPRGTTSSTPTTRSCSSRWASSSSTCCAW